MRYLVLLLIIVSSFSGYSQKAPKNGPYIKHFKNGQIKTSGQYKKGEKVGVWKYYYDTGQLSRKYEYDNLGKTTGSEETYYKKGDLKSKCALLKEGGFIEKGYFEASNSLSYEMHYIYKEKSNYKITTGIYREFFFNGKTKIKSNYVDGKLDGLWTRFYETGIKEWDVNYQMGIKKGGYKKHFKNGGVVVEGANLKDKKTGEEKRYNKNGDIEWKGSYIEDHFVKTWIKYDANGKELLTLKFKNGKQKKANKDVILSPTKIPIGVFEMVPVYPGCKTAMSNLAKKKCMSKKISEFISKKFNTNVASNIGLQGKQRINVIEVST